MRRDRGTFVSGALLRSVIFAVSIAVTGTGCVTRYTKRDLIVTDTTPRTTFADYYAGTGDEFGLKKSFETTDAKCLLVNRAMEDEAAGLQRQSAVVRGVFLGLAGLLALSSGIYALTDSPDPAVSAGLGFGATATAVPTFLFFGADEREGQLRKRLGQIDAARIEEMAAYNQLGQEIGPFKDAQSALTTAQKALADAQAKPEAVEVLAAKGRAVEEAQKAVTAATENWRRARTAMMAQVTRLSLLCQ